MKDDKFLIGIVVGIIALIVVAVVSVYVRGAGREEYIADDTPAGVVHNYFLAVQREDYEKAYSYLSDDLAGKPDIDKFIRDIDNAGRNEQAALQIEETNFGDVRSQVDVSITTYRYGGLFDRNSYTNEGTAHLLATSDGAGWRLTGFPFPYWGYDWYEDEE